MNWKEWHSWRWLLGIVTLLALWDVLRASLVQSQGIASEFLGWEGVAYEFLFVYLLALFIPLLWSLEKHLHFQNWGWKRWLVVHVALSAGFTLIWLTFSIVINWAMRSLLWPPVVFGQLPFKANPLNFSLNTWYNYWSILAVFYGVDAYRRWRERELVAARLATQLTQARLQALQMQLHPHFLFNTLQTISALIRRDAEAAERMLARLGDLLRIVLERGEEPLVPLSQELEFVRKYLEIQQIRFRERLQVDWQIAPEALEMEVPTLILQPLVENALKHGLEGQPKPGSLKIGAQRLGDRLRLWVQDDGPGLHSDRVRNGVGLSNIRERLVSLYGAAGSLQLTDRGPEGGLQAVIELPIRAESHSQTLPSARLRSDGAAENSRSGR